MKQLVNNKVAILVLGVIPCIQTQAQEYLISGPIINACSGVLLDSGGSTGEYSNNEYRINYICPDQPGYRIFLNWTLCALDATNGADRITIWNGIEDNSPMIGQYTGTQLQGQLIIATFANASGCLKVRFQSYAAGTGDFAATITCQPRLPGEVAINMAPFDTCQAVLYDSGGAGGPGYHGNETVGTRICPTEAGTFVNLDFQIFDLSESGTGDHLLVYDGMDTNAPLMGSFSGNSLEGEVISASASNSTGCLSVHFRSNATDHGRFIADISCGGPCDPPVAQFTSAVADSARLCPGVVVEMDGGASETVPGRTIVSYRWYNNGELFDTSSDPIHGLGPLPGGLYNVSLQVVDDLGCPSILTDVITLWVSPTPDHSNTAYPAVACTGATMVFDAAPTRSPFIRPDGCLGPSEPIFLPDDLVAINDFPLLIAGAAPGSTITSMEEIGDVCVEIEHTFSSDLVISLVCPDGRLVVLQEQDLPGWAFLGDANDLDDNDDPQIGTCWNYCWNATSTVGTWQEAVDIGVPYVINTSQYLSLVPGTYTPTGSMADLIGCPVNGIWKLRIVDVLFADNGFLCNWCLGVADIAAGSFAGNLPILGTADPDSSYWLGPFLVNDLLDPTVGSAVHPEPGLFEYTYTVLDSYGCEHTSSFPVEVVAPPMVNAGPDLFYCSDPVQIHASVVGGSEPHACTWILRLSDSVGNAWNANAHIDVVIDGAHTSFTVPNGVMVIDHELEVMSGQHILLDYTSGIASNNQNGVELLDPFGVTLVTIQGGPSTGILYDEIAECGSGNTSYTWTPSAGLSNTHGFAPFASPSSSTNYVLTVEVGGAAGCAGSDTVQISTQGASPFHVMYDESAWEFCTDVQSFVSYEWYRSGNLVAQTSDPCYSTTENGAWTVVGVNDQGCVAFADTALLCPSISISLSNFGMMMINTIGGYASYSWTLNGEPLPVTGPSLVALYGGLYEVTVTTTYGCVMTASLEVADLPVGLGEGPLFDNWLHVYPVPNNGSFTAMVRRATAAPVQLGVFDLTGRLLHGRQLPMIAGEVRIPIELDLAPGAYFVEVRTIDERMVQRIVVE